MTQNNADCIIYTSVSFRFAYQESGFAQVETMICKINTYNTINFRVSSEEVRPFNLLLSASTLSLTDQGLPVPLPPLTLEPCLRPYSSIQGFQLCNPGPLSASSHRGTRPWFQNGFSNWPRSRGRKWKIKARKSKECGKQNCVQKVPKKIET